jgi:hypothetical protein
MRKLPRQISVAFAAFCIAGVCVGQTSSKWELVRSVPYPTGGTQEFIVVPEEKQRDLDYHRQIADAICGARTHCMVFYWTNRDSISTSASFDGPAMRTLIGQYERHPNYSAPHLRLACWLYPSKEVGEKANCFYMPGAEVPPSR